MPTGTAACWSFNAPQRGLSDDERAARNDAIFQTTTALMHQPAETLADIDLKLAVLCARLRSEDYAPLSPGGALTVLLGESARDDIKRTDYFNISVSSILHNRY